MEASRQARGWEAFRHRLQSREDSEHEQAVLRIVIVTAVLVWMGLSYEPASDDNARTGAMLLIGLSVDLLFALALFFAICIYPRANVARRIVGSIADNSTATFVMFMTGEAGFSMIGVYLFVAFGNGFRYGRRYLFISQGLALAGLSSVLFVHEYWRPLQTAGWSLFVALVVLPVYVSTLLKRIHDAQRRAEEANLAKTSFLANMSHEMRTPLNGIVGAADLVLATPLSAQQAELVQLLSHSTKVLRSLVDDVLDISKIEAGRLNVQHADFDLHATLNGVIHLLRPQVEAKGLRFRALVDPAIDYQIIGDQHHLRQVLLNLTSNAIKFTHRGEVCVEAILSGETEAEIRVRFEVRDTGIGIAPEAQSRIFDAFVQADDSTTRRFGGTGLGTTIAKQLVELMKGRIGLESRLGVGSLFWFEIPFNRSEAAVERTGGFADIAGLFVDDLGEQAHGTRRALEQVSIEFKRVSPEAVAEHLGELRKKPGVRPLLIVTGSVERAFEVVQKSRKCDSGVDTPLIHVAADPKAARAFELLAGVSNLQVVGPNASARELRNAIHAVTIRDLGERSYADNLALVLQQQRKPARILVAEDNTTNLAILRHLLESAGHTVLAAVDGEQALDLFEAHSPDLAILDFNMPERNGVEVVAAIRAMEAVGSRLPVVILSAAVTPEAKAQAKIGGADEFVGKPFDAAFLLQTVDRLASQNVAVQPIRPPVLNRSASHPLPAVVLLDESRLDEVGRIGRTPEFLGRLLEGFCSDVHELLHRLDAASASGQTGLIEDVLHSIKGAAVSIGAAQLASRCREMEGIAQRGELSRIFELSPLLRESFEQTLAALSSYGKHKGIPALLRRQAACSTALEE